MHFRDPAKFVKPDKLCDSTSAPSAGMDEESHAIGCQDFERTVAIMIGPRRLNPSSNDKHDICPAKSGLSLPQQALVGLAIGGIIRIQVVSLTVLLEGALSVAFAFQSDAQIEHRQVIVRHQA